MNRTESRLLTLVLLIGLTVRLCWTLRQPVALDRLPDQCEYAALGLNLLQHHALYFWDARFHQNVWAYRMPGYPAFLAACDASILAIRIVQCVIDTSTILAVYLIARQLSGGIASATPARFTAPVAALFLALNPFYIYFSGLILTETLFAALLAWAIFCLIKGRWLIATVILVAGCYIRPSGLIFIPCLAALSFTNNKMGRSYRLKSAAVAALITFFCLMPWAMRNHYRLGSWVFTTTNGGITAYDGFHTGATGASDQRFITDFTGLSSMNEVERARFFTQQAMDWIRKEPMQIPRLCLRKLLRGWSPIPLSAEFGKPIYRWVSALYTVPFDLLCLVGIFSGRLTGRAKILLTMPAILVTVLQLMSVGSIRYRMPAEAPLAVVAAMGAADILRVKKSVQLAAN